MNRIPPLSPFASTVLADLDAAEARLNATFDATRRTPADLHGGDRPQWAAFFAAADAAYAEAYDTLAIARATSRLLGV
jgi:hypothetical protein